MTAPTTGSHPGARWWKFDFHNHTPASLDTHWARSHEAIAPEVWLLRYMQAEVDCVAVTDHNCGAWIDRLKHAYVAMQAAPPAGFRELYLFPGVEISVSGGIHLLAIFDPSKTSSDIDTLLGLVQYLDTKGDGDGVTRKSLTEAVDAIVQAGGMPIPAHADAPKGLLQVKDGRAQSAALDANTLRQLCTNPKILAMEIINPTAPKPAVYTEAGCLWTEVIGSDSHGYPDGPTPGSRYTWVKMAKPSLDGLRLALLDGERFSVRRSDALNGFDPFQRPAHFIDSIEISDARYMGRCKPATFSFSPWFNALVGGRGTGKSTVVHALRLAYRRVDDLKRLEDGSEARRVFEAFNRIPKNRVDTGGLRPDTEIIVVVSRDGVSYRLRWRQDGTGPAVEEWLAGAWTLSASPSITPERFPIRIFSQGQIAALAGESQGALLGLIDEVAQTRHAKRTLDEAIRRFLALRAQVREVSSKLMGRDEAAVALADVQRKLTGFEGKEHTEILKTFQRRSRQERELERQLETAHLLVSTIQDLAAQLVLEDPAPDVFDLADAADKEALSALARMNDAVAGAVGSVQAAGAGLQASVRSIRETLETGTWHRAVRSAREKYEMLADELQAQGVDDPSGYGKLVQERQRIDSDLERFDSLRKERDKLAGDAREQQERVRNARQELSSVRRTFLAEALAKNGYVRITLVPYGRDPRAIERQLREVLGAVDRFEDEILTFEGDEPRRGLVADLLRELPRDAVAASNTLEVRLDAWGPRFECAAEGQAEFGARFTTFLQRECGKSPEILDRLLVFAPEDTLAIEYSPQGNGKNFRSINQGSAGQRAAAMLAFLLAQGSEPIVLDQPEDDLDNHLIYDLVVRQIRENKMHRQLIVVTHNPNIVVNGDADMLHALDFQDGQCRALQSGSLQESAMREEVCRVMEGGREAFERRYVRLGGLN